MKIMILLLIVWANLLFNLSHAQDMEVTNINDSVTEITIANSLVTLEIASSQLRSKSAIIIPWIRYSAKAVELYYGKFPVKSYRLQLISTAGDSVSSGHAYGGKIPLIEVYIGEKVTSKKLKNDWVLVHEMIHLALAELPRRHHWLVEGLAVYIESIARVQSGQLDQGIVWKSFINSMPKGLPKAGDRGLDFTPTWGRRYWGGALFCLQADLKIRQLTDNHSGLQDALRGILNAGYSMNSEGDIESILTMGDKVTGQSVLISLYNKMKAQPVTTDLPNLWQSLGVSMSNGEIVYDNNAPQAISRLKIFQLKH